MENSPLRFLDSDLSKIINKQVRCSREIEARKFHENLLRSSLKYCIFVSEKNTPYILKQNINNYIKKYISYRYLINFNYYKNNISVSDIKFKSCVKRIVERYESPSSNVVDCDICSLLYLLPCGDYSNGAQCMCDICIKYSSGDLDKYC